MPDLVLLQPHGDYNLEHTVSLEQSGGRLYFGEDLPFCFRDEVKAMRNPKWHGYIKGDGRKIWSVLDCPRNWVQLDYLQGNTDLWDWFAQPIQRHEYREYRNYKHPQWRVLPHQLEMADPVLTYGAQVIAGEMGVGKTLAAQMIMEKTGGDWWWIGPLRSLDNIKRELDHWGFDGSVQISFMTYDALVARAQAGFETLPLGLFCDEAHFVKHANSKRAIATQMCADAMRAKHRRDCRIVLASGSPSPKNPTDWWSLAEIVCPGYLRESSAAALEKRCAVMELKEYADGPFWKPTGWKEDEVRLLGRRLRGIVTVKFAKDCIQLPEMHYERISCPASPSLLRTARAIAEAAGTGVEAFTALRELSDGFQYRQQQLGTKPCTACDAGRLTTHYFNGLPMEGDCEFCGGTGDAPHFVRETIEIPCSKDKALTDILGSCEETGRIVIFAGFTGSIDRVQRLCQKKGWHVVRCDGRGFCVFDPNGQQLTGEKPLEFWAGECPKVAYVAHPESGGMSFTLTESRVVVFWSNSFKAQYRPQAVARVLRQGCRGCTVYDLCCLPSDDRTITIITENRRLELMTLQEALGNCLAIAT